MKKRKRTALVASLSLVAVIGIGATLAYFTDNASTKNVVTMGHVDITLTENKVHKDQAPDKWVQEEGTDAITDKGLEFNDVLPGETVPKNPTITLVDDSVDAYVRIKMEITAPAGSTITPEDLSVLETKLRAQILKENPNWYYNSKDGYYYYNGKMSSGDAIALFESVTIPGEEWGNNTADQSFSIVLQAEAIQADYFTPEMTGSNITSWNGADVSSMPAD